MTMEVWAFLLALYIMPVPDTSETENFVSAVFLLILPLVIVQAPLLAVVQLADEPPTVNPPLTTAPGTSTPLLFFTATVTLARHPLTASTEAPVSDATETSVELGGGGDVPASPV